MLLQAPSKAPSKASEGTRPKTAREAALQCDSPGQPPQGLLSSEAFDFQLHQGIE